VKRLLVNETRTRQHGLFPWKRDDDDDD
jgi:hypothetical protein